MANKKVNAYNKKHAELDQELIDILMAISVISKRLAKKLLERNMEVQRNGRTYKPTR